MPLPSSRFVILFLAVLLFCVVAVVSGHLSKHPSKKVKFPISDPYADHSDDQGIIATDADGPIIVTVGGDPDNTSDPHRMFSVNPESYQIADHLQFPHPCFGQPVYLGNKRTIFLCLIGYTRTTSLYLVEHDKDHKLKLVQTLEAFNGSLSVVGNHGDSVFAVDADNSIYTLNVKSWTLNKTSDSVLPASVLIKGNSAVCGGGKYLVAAIKDTNKTRSFVRVDLSTGAVDTVANTGRAYVSPFSDSVAVILNATAETIEIQTWDVVNWNLTSTTMVPSENITAYDDGIMGFQVASDSLFFIGTGPGPRLPGFLVQYELTKAGIPKPASFNFVKYNSGPGTPIAVSGKYVSLYSGPMSIMRYSF
eukprot:gnl/Hemi2/11753_TR4033_c0_g1_i1.p1 gnl/Hemi2/11753_TR4033_c0_g1~~gnl/Hemi2/11753_TR4033_c0_g1_i1.p1  ORF type:complete len:381 (+),score=107.85 gnl/Hemi2/11753_TR4033_c0_g1_i1:57-1145(+)